MISTKKIVFLVFLVIDVMANQTFASDELYSPKRVSKIMENIMLMIKRKDYDKAQDNLIKTVSKTSDKHSIQLRHMLAKLYRKRKDYLAEATTYHDILQIAPDDIEAVRERSFALLRMGAADLAADLSAEKADVFSKAERLVFRQLQAGRHIKWGEIEARYGIGLQRFDSADKSILENSLLRAKYKEAEKSNNTSAVRVEFDRVVALRNRVRMKQAIALFSTIRKRERDIPAYVLAAAADAYLHQKQPEIARDLYLQAFKLIEKKSQHPERLWQFGLLQAYMDVNQFDEAQALATQLVETIPSVLHKGLRRAEVDNEYYERARVDSARVLLYADKLQESEFELAEILKEAPFNLDARLALAELRQARNQPRNARDKFTSVLVDDPANHDASVGIAQSSIELADYSTARTHIDRLTRHYPENYSVQRVERMLKAYLSPRLTVTSGFGTSKGGGGNRGDSDWEVDAIVDSGPIFNNYSLFARTFNAEASFEDDVATRRRMGIGLQYLNPSWKFAIEIDRNQTGRSQTGVATRATWFVNDHWLLDAQFESNSNSIPVQAHGAGVEAKALATGLRFSSNESRNLGIDFSYLWLSDGNRRANIALDWFQRWMSGPVYKLDTKLSTSASNNSLKDTAYFNPQYDTSFDLLLINEWTLWRRDLRSYKHLLSLGVGGYWQQDFGVKETTSVRYEHQWDIDVLRSLNFGVEYSRHPYDGVTSARTAFFLNFSWSF